MKNSAFLAAFADTLTTEARKWMSVWIKENRAALLSLPLDEGNAVLGGGAMIQYGLDLEMKAAPLLLQALQRLEHGSTGVPAVGILTKLREHLLPIINEPLSLQ